MPLELIYKKETKTDYVNTYMVLIACKINVNNTDSLGKFNGNLQLRPKE